MSGLGNIFVLHQLRVLGIDDVLLVALNVTLLIVGGGGVLKFSLAPLRLERPAVVLQASVRSYQLQSEAGRILVVSKRGHFRPALL